MLPDLLQNLDFDFEKCCSVTLSGHNVYACLVCGKYFQVGLAAPGSPCCTCCERFCLIK